MGEPATHDAAVPAEHDAAADAAAARRELRTEAVVAVAFLGTAAALWALDGGPFRLGLAVWLAVVCAVLVRVEFEVGEGVTRPVQLVLASMFVLLPAGQVPAVVAAAHVLARLLDARPADAPRRSIVAISDGWFVIPPAALVLWLGIPAAPGWIPLFVLALAVAQSVADFVASAIRVRVGAGVPVHELVRPFAWVYLVDLLLIPIGVLASLVTRAHPVALVAVLPLAALLAVFARERTGRLRNAARLQQVTEESRERLQSIVANASDLIAIVRRDGTMSELTGAVESVFGAEWRAALDAPLLSYVHPEDAARVRTILETLFAKPQGETMDAEWRLLYPDGSWRHVEAVATNLADDPRVEGLVLTARDVDERKAFEEQLRHRAFHDPLTQLANRALFYDRIEHALSRDDRQAAVLYIDLDGFKPINDRFGHAAGDQLLVEVAARLRQCLRGADTVARFGGDEFGVLLEAMPSANEPIQAGERILAALKEPFTLGGEALQISASVGVALAGARDRGVDEVLRRADLAMYHAKRNGGRRLELYDERLDATSSDAAPLERAVWFQSIDEQREEIQSVLESADALQVVVQPIMDLRTGRVAGYEALSRFKDPLGRPPNAWFAQAHRCGLGYDLEAKAIAAALALTGRPAGRYLTLNLSPSALTSEAVTRVLPPRLDGLVIEITENEVISDDPEVSAALDDIRARGARLAIDDTGSGYAGLQHVMRLAPDIIKLDRALVAGVCEDPVKASLIESFVRYARDIDADVCAEGIETTDDLARLADLDVAYGQGYGIGRPGPDWAEPAPEATETCRVSFTTTLVDPRAQAAGQDQRLEQVGDRLAHVHGREDLVGVLGAIARELRASGVRVVAVDGTATVLADAALTGAPVMPFAPLAVLSQLLAGDPDAPLADVHDVIRLGYRSRLRVPIALGGEPLAVLEAYSTDDRPWSRFEIRRARIISHQLGSALARAGAAVSG
jgi:diguanylate cyclase (GGDEF)-like protein/PAS domain S-box-containing protein